MFLTYNEYSVMKGVSCDGTPSKSEIAKYNSLEYDAEKTIDKYTFGRIKALSPIPAEVKRAVFELIENISESKQFGNLQSETVGKWSRSYSAKSSTDTERDLSEIVYRNLRGVLIGGVPAIYAGVERRE